MRKIAVVTAAVLVASFTLSGCAELQEKLPSQLFNRQETAPVVVEREHGEKEKSSLIMPREETNPENSENNQNENITNEALIMEQEFANPGTQQGRVVEVSLLVYGMAEHKDGVLKFYATLPDDKQKAVMVTILDEEEDLEICVGDFVDVVGIITDSCKAPGVDGDETTMPKISATDVTLHSEKNNKEDKKTEDNKQPKTSAAPTQSKAPEKSSEPQESEANAA